MYQLQTFKIRILPSIFGLLTIRMSSLCCLASIACWRFLIISSRGSTFDLDWLVWQPGSEFSQSLVCSFDFHFHWLPFWIVFNMGWSLSELLLACLRASRSLAPTQGNLESVWELDSMSATSKKRTSRGYPTISMTVSRTRSLGEYIFSDKKVTLLRRFPRRFSFLIYFPHFWWYTCFKEA